VSAPTESGLANLFRHGILFGFTVARKAMLDVL
jgi:hypothetical protein